MYSKESKQKLGAAIDDFIQNRAKWPESLVTYYNDLVESLSPARRSRGLTYDMLLDWMAIELGVPELADESYKQTLVTLIGRIRNWKYQPTGSGSDNFLLFSSLAEAGVIWDDDYQITQVNELVAFLFNRLEKPTD